MSLPPVLYSARSVLELEVEVGVGGGRWPEASGVLAERKRRRRAATR